MTEGNRKCRKRRKKREGVKERERKRISSTLWFSPQMTEAGTE